MGRPRRALLVLALLGWLVPAAATLGTDNPLREGVRRLVRPPAPPADPWGEALRDVGNRLPSDHEVAIWLDPLPRTPDAVVARGYEWVSAAYRLYPRRVFLLAPRPTVDALEARGLVGPSAAGVMRGRLGALARGERTTLALLVWDGNCETAGPPGTLSLRALVTFSPGRCVLVVGGAAS